MDFNATNNQSSKKAFHMRALYKEYALEKYDNLELSDFLYANPLYGKVDEMGYAISPKEEFLKLYSTGADEPVAGLFFVVDAFENFWRSLLFTATERYKNLNGLSNILGRKVKKSYQSVDLDYHDHQENIFIQFFDIIESNSIFRKKACSFKSFLKIYFWFLEKIAPRIPITKPMYTISNYSSPNISGLIVELEDADAHEDDSIKQRLFLDDPLFDLYLKEAASFGFSVDKNAPWRLIARVNEPKWDYFLGFEGIKRNNLFQKCYLKTYFDDYNDFKLSTMQVYNSIVGAFPSETYTGFSKNTGKMKIEIKPRSPVTDQVMNQTSEMYWLKKYFYIRLLEKKGKVKENMFKDNCKKIASIYKHYGLTKTLESMEKLLIKMPAEADPFIRTNLYDYGPFDIETGKYSF